MTSLFFNDNEPFVQPRAGRIRAYGGSIVPQVAATFVRSFMEAVGLTSAPAQ